MIPVNETRGVGEDQALGMRLRLFLGLQVISALPRS